MAKEDEKKPTAAEKGKAKAPVNGDAEKDAKNGKDAKPDSDDKKGVATATGMSCLPEQLQEHRERQLS
jgi:26S proteasome regulatory subunit N1